MLWMSSLETMSWIFAVHQVKIPKKQRSDQNKKQRLISPILFIDMAYKGAKLCMVAGLLTNSGNVRSNRSQSSNQLHMDITGTVTGVDISPHRLSTCRALLKRHRLQQHARLFQADGTTFGVMRPSAIDTIRARIMAGSKSKGQEQQELASSGKRSLDDDEEEEDEQQGQAMEVALESEARKQFHTNYTNEASSENAAKRQRPTLDMFSGVGQSQPQETLFNGTETPLSQEKVVPFYAPKVLRNDPQLQSEGYKYDKVIVDAECKFLSHGITDPLCTFLVKKPHLTGDFKQTNENRHARRLHSPYP